jgi:ribonuclease E
VADKAEADAAAQPVETTVEAPAAAPASAPAPVSAPVSAPVEAEQPVVAQAAPVAPAPVAAAPVDLNEVLEKAGLTLASTDPEKLRAAQEAAAHTEAPARPRRTRKPAPPPVNEPLIQVDTRQ